MPKKKPRRLKAFIYGKSGVGKTVGVLKLCPNAMIIDTEDGTEFYDDFIEQQGSEVLRTNDVPEILACLKGLEENPREFSSLIIDPVTSIWESLQTRWTDIFTETALRRNKHHQVATEDFGMTFWSKVKAQHTRLNTWIKRLDMNIVMTAHEKDMWSDESGTLKKVGITYNGMKDLEYLFDVVFRMELNGDKRLVHCIKERTFPGPLHFEKKTFEWDSDKIREYWGVEDMDRIPDPVVPATDEQVKRMKHLVDILSPPVARMAAWRGAAKCREWSEFPYDKLAKCIAVLEKELSVREQDMDCQESENPK